MVKWGKSDWDGVTNAISASVNTRVENESKKSEVNFKFLKDKTLKLASAFEHNQ